MAGNFKNTLYIEGHFETEKYFKDFEDNIKNEFTLRSVNSVKNTQIYKDINNTNSVSICVRQNRFSERKRAITKKDDENSLSKRVLKIENLIYPKALKKFISSNL